MCQSHSLRVNVASLQPLHQTLSKQRRRRCLPKCGQLQKLRRQCPQSYGRRPPWRYRLAANAPCRLCFGSSGRFLQPFGHPHRPPEPWHLLLQKPQPSPGQFLRLRRLQLQLYSAISCSPQRVLKVFLLNTSHGLLKCHSIDPWSRKPRVKPDNEPEPPLPQSFRCAPSECGSPYTVRFPSPAHPEFSCGSRRGRCCSP